MAMAQFSAIKWWLRLPSKSVCRTVYHYDFDYYLKNVCLHAFNLAFWRIYRRRLQMERPTEKVIMIRSNSHAISVPPLHVDSYISFLSSGKNHSLVSVRYRLVGFRLTDIVLLTRCISNDSKHFYFTLLTTLSFVILWSDLSGFFSLFFVLLHSFGNKMLK